MGIFCSSAKATVTVDQDGKISIDCTFQGWKAGVQATHIVEVALREAARGKTAEDTLCDTIQDPSPPSGFTP
jgi:hypothetical protein